MKRIIDLFLSLKTAFSLFLLFVFLAAVGSISLAGNLAFFSGIDDTPLFIWLAESRDLKRTWWIFLMILLFGMLAINTIFCTIDALVKRSGWRNIVLKLSPQVMHIGVLFIMLGHLLTASLGFKTDMLIGKGEKQEVIPGTEIYLDDILVETDANGYHISWEVKLSWFVNGRETDKGTLKPLHPLYFGRIGLYSKSVVSDANPSALIRICSDPGALWGLLGAVTLSVGGLAFLFGRFRGQE